MQTDPRISQLARNLVGYSLGVKSGEIVYVDLVGLETQPLGRELIREVTRAGGVPYWNTFDDGLAIPFLQEGNETQYKAFAKMQADIMTMVDCYVGLRGQSNPYALSALDTQRQAWRNTHYWKTVHSDVRLHKRWCVLRYPSPTMAVLAQTDTESFEDHYFKVCNLDYGRMSEAMDSLVSRMEKIDQVRLVAPNTDISFSIKGIPVIKCDGKVNIPDGEVFTAPVRESVNGHITYNTTTFYDGTLFKNIRLEVCQGRIEKVSCEGGSLDALKKIFDTDAGARYFGEFAIGVNPHILHPMNDTLFDEKIAGSIHLTPGSSYDNAFNGNKSSIHWDIVLIQRDDYGGGEIYFDGECIRRDGIFLTRDLECLNPENLA